MLTQLVEEKEFGTFYDLGFKYYGNGVVELFSKQETLEDLEVFLTNFIGNGLRVRKKSASIDTIIRDLGLIDVMKQTSLVRKVVGEIIAQEVLLDAVVDYCAAKQYLDNMQEEVAKLLDSNKTKQKSKKVNRVITEAIDYVAFILNERQNSYSFSFEDVFNSRNRKVMLGDYEVILGTLGVKLAEQDQVMKSLAFLELYVSEEEDREVIREMQPYQGAIIGFLKANIAYLNVGYSVEKNRRYDDSDFFLLQEHLTNMIGLEETGFFDVSEDFFLMKKNMLLLYKSRMHQAEFDGVNMGGQILGAQEDINRCEDKLAYLNELKEQAYIIIEPELNN